MNQFLQKGGIREQMYAARTQYRTHQSINPPTKSKKSDSSDSQTSRTSQARQTGLTNSIKQPK